MSKRKIIELDLGYIRYVYHMADIHIRLNERIEEYSLVFDRLYESIKEKSVGELSESVVIIAGDIFDAKTNLKTESLELFDRLMNLLKLMPIIIIAGNHDGNMTNEKYKDALHYVSNLYNRIHLLNPSAINKLYYLNQTGLYQSENLLIGVKHIFDQVNKFPSIQRIKSDLTKIAIHHGTITGSRTDLGQVLVAEDHISMFSGYDYVFLGDIHKYQFLSETSNIVYPGSLLQQNHGESIDKHGYIKWDIIDNWYEYVEVYNSYGYITINMRDNLVVDQ